MRAYTKQWYLGAQQSTLSGEFAPDARAAAFSEALYRELYDEKLAEHLRFEREIAKMQAADLMREHLAPFVDAEEISRVAFDELIADTERKDRAQASFDEREAAREFDRRMRETIRCYRSRLPAEILANVADPRVLGLGFAAPDVYDQIQAYCQTKRQETQRALDTYGAYCRSIQHKLPEPIRESFFALHDARIESVQREGNSLVLSIGKGSFVRTIRFVDCEIELLEDLVGAEWLYGELYLTDGGYEAGALAIMSSVWGDDAEGALREFWLCARDIEITQDEAALQAAMQLEKQLIEKGLARPIDSNGEA